ncbi:MULTISPECIES: hypothetical protein [unclassified Caballeronia]|uniref:hypothetical protein n=1 Tax=unclassified Caballeronia TaxID=2646786 RepID=UPI00202920EF|nr:MULTISPECIES: hypothetical protein [unclassified Caballeronia]
MTPEQFSYWLQGFVELGNGAAPTPEQWKSIREHLDTVFKKVTPPVQTGPSDPVKDPAAGKSLEEILRRSIQPSHPVIPPMQQPYWLQPGPGVTYPVNPMIVTC